VDPVDALPRAVALLAALVASPFAVGALLGWAFAEPRASATVRRARLAALPGLVAGAFLVGVALLPAPYAAGPLDPVRLGGGLTCAALVGALSHPRGLWRGLLAPDAWARPALAGALVGLGPPLFLLAAAWMTRLDGAPRAEGAAEAASRRLLIVPWDPEAHLALGWRDALRGERAPAGAHLDFAERAGADAVEALELRAELAAQGGDCEAARRAFDEALERRTRRAMAEVLSTPLELDDYALPPSLVRVCGPGDALSGP
jgi:hypothetical protein